MKQFLKLTACAITAIVIIACNKSDDNTDCVTLEENSNWQSEMLIPQTHDIQFPDDYEGLGLTGFEGPIFFKHKPDSSVFFQYSFCGPLFCEPFGVCFDQDFDETEEVPLDWLSSYFDPLDIRQDFCDNGDKLRGMFFHNDRDEASGRYYMLVDTMWKESLQVNFEIAKLEEVKNILATISER